MANLSYPYKPKPWSMVLAVRFFALVASSGGMPPARDLRQSVSTLLLEGR